MNQKKWDKINKKLNSITDEEFESWYKRYKKRKKKELQYIKQLDLTLETTLLKAAYLSEIEKQLDKRRLTKQDLADILGINIETLLDLFTLNIDPSSRLLVEIGALLGGRFEVRFKSNK